MYLSIYLERPRGYFSKLEPAGVQFRFNIKRPRW